MSEVECPSSAEAEPEKKSRPRLIDRTEGERWPVPASVSVLVFRQLEEIVTDPTADRREVLAAANALIAVSRLNQANIELTIKVKKIEELEERMTEIELHIENDRKAGGFAEYR